MSREDLVGLALTMALIIECGRVRLFKIETKVNTSHSDILLENMLVFPRNASDRGSQFACLNLVPVTTKL